MEWRPIESHARYEVSRDGQIRNAASKRIIGQWMNPQGYMLAILSKPRMTVRVHRAVATAFIANPDKLPYVNHKDCVRSNNQDSNLEWCTQWQNLKHSELLGRMQRDYWIGRRSPSARLSDETAQLIRAEYSRGGVSWESLGKKFSISKRSVGRIINGESYV